MLKSVDTPETDEEFVINTSDTLREFFAFCRVPRLLYDGEPGYGAHPDFERWTLYSPRFNPHFKLLEASQGWVARRNGKPSSLNIGIRMARGKFIAITDADSVIQYGSMQHWLLPFADPRVGAATAA